MSYDNLVDGAIRKCVVFKKYYGVFPGKRDNWPNNRVPILRGWYKESPQ